AYGIRNTFGMAFDPVSGELWLEENGDDSFSELHRISPGQNSGWVQIRGPVSRIGEYKAIETSPGTDPCIGGTYFGLQPLRGSPTTSASSTSPRARACCSARTSAWSRTSRPAPAGTCSRSP